MRGSSCLLECSRRHVERLRPTSRPAEQAGLVNGRTCPASAIRYGGLTRLVGMEERLVGPADIDTTRFQRAAPVRSNGARIAATVESWRSAPGESSGLFLGQRRERVIGCSRRHVERFRPTFSPAEQGEIDKSKDGALASAIREAGLPRLDGVEKNAGMLGIETDPFSAALLSPETSCRRNGDARRRPLPFSSCGPSLICVPAGCRCCTV